MIDGCLHETSEGARGPRRARTYLHLMAVDDLRKLIRRVILESEGYTHGHDGPSGIELSDADAVALRSQLNSDRTMRYLQSSGRSSADIMDMELLRKFMPELQPSDVKEIDNPWHAENVIAKLWPDTRELVSHDIHRASQRVVFFRKQETMDAFLSACDEAGIPCYPHRPVVKQGGSWVRTRRPTCVVFDITALTRAVS